MGFSVGGDAGHVAIRWFLTGLHWVWKNRQGFDGLTWLSREFHGQPEAQILR